MRHAEKENSANSIGGPIGVFCIVLQLFIGKLFLQKTNLENI